MSTEFESTRFAEKERFFREFAVWPVYDKFDTDGWLSNFLPEEREVAERILTNFNNFNEQMTDSLLRSSLQKHLSTFDEKYKYKEVLLTSILDNTVFVMCEGENPNPTDSGNLFARKLRSEIGIPDTHILWPNDALKQRSNFANFIFVDDFAGSGNQFLTTWNSQHSVGGSKMSFSDFATQVENSFAYCCCVATSKAIQKILKCAPSVKISPAHQIAEESNVTSEHSRIWEGIDPIVGIQTIKRASMRAGYEAEDCGQNDWRGFHCLGLALAFSHGIPDASLPIFFSGRKNWKPLITRADHE